MLIIEGFDIEYSGGILDTAVTTVVVVLVYMLLVNSLNVTLLSMLKDSVGLV